MSSARFGVKRLSVIVPTFNRDNLVVAGLQSYLAALAPVARESDFDLEFIVVDDHSSDHTFSRLNEHFGELANFRIIQLPVNSGPGPARDAGIQIASGDWVWFLDDDDKLDPSKLPELLHFLGSVGNDVDLVAHSLKKTSSRTPSRAQIAQSMLNFREHQEVFRYVFRRQLIISSATTFSPGVHEDIRYVFELLSHARRVAVVPERVVIKQRTAGAITDQMSNSRIDGYIRSYNEIATLLQNSQLSGPQARERMFDQTLGVLIYQIATEKDDARAIALLEHLRLASQGGDAWSIDLKAAPQYGPTDTNFEYAGSIWRTQSQIHPTRLLSALRGVFATRLSCKDLDSSLFLAPDEIRACCKRFFVDGARKGDVVLLKAGESVGLPEIQAAKDSLIARINSGEAHECTGCPYIERRPAYRRSIDYISLENFTYCNLRCTYCSPTYYGGSESSYNATAIIQQLADAEDGLSDSCHVVWGGGEPTLSPRFKPVNDVLSSLPQVSKIRVLSNSVRFSDNLAANLKDSRFHLVTSVDAGTAEGFLKIRGRKGIDDVLANLSSYRKLLDDPRRLTVKYIVCADNFDSSEFEAYVDRLPGSGLLDCMFEVSCDFKLDKPIDDMVCALYELAVRLRNAGAEIVFFDDLIRDRVTIDGRLARLVLNHLDRVGVDHVKSLLSPESEWSVVLWGAGKQAHWLSQQTASSRNGRVRAVVSDATAWHNLGLSDDPSVLLYPAGVQSMHDILRNIENAGLSSRLFSGVIL